MTLDEVKKVLGLPPGDYASRPLIDCGKEELLRGASNDPWKLEMASRCGSFDAVWNKGFLLCEDHHQRCPEDRKKIKGWISDTGMIFVRLDDFGKVSHKEFWRHRPCPSQNPVQLFTAYWDAYTDARLSR